MANIKLHTYSPIRQTRQKGESIALFMDNNSNFKIIRRGNTYNDDIECDSGNCKE